MYSELGHNGIVDFSDKGPGIKFKNGDSIPNRFEFTHELTGIQGPFETFTRICGEPNFTVEDDSLEDNPRVWCVNYDNKFDFLALVTREYKGSQFEIIFELGEDIEKTLSEELFIQWLKDLYFLIKTRGHNVSQKISSLDPLGEEWWDDEEIKENKLFENENHFNYDDKEKFKIGDRVFCLGEYRSIKFKGERGTILGFYRNGSYINEIFVKFDTKFSGQLEAGDLCQDPSCHSYYVGCNHVHLIDPVKEEEHRKKMEEIRLMHIDIDPYSEDDWHEDYNERLTTKFELFENRYPINESETFGVGDNVIILLPSHEMLNNIKGRIIRRFDGEKKIYYVVRTKYGEVPMEKHELELIPQTFSEQDPYGEEDWDLNEEYNIRNLPRFGDKFMYVMANIFGFLNFTRDNNYKKYVKMHKDKNIIINRINKFLHNETINKLLDNIIENKNQEELNEMVKYIMAKYKTDYGRDLMVDLKILQIHFMIFDESYVKKIENIRKMLVVRNFSPIDPLGEEDWEN
jgi:hypothetical protein